MACKGAPCATSFHIIYRQWKKLEEVVGGRWWCVMSNYYLYEFFIKIINNKKLEENDGINDDVYILHVKRYVIKIYSGLEKWCDA
jgi:hypothetical protein